MKLHQFAIHCFVFIMLCALLPACTGSYGTEGPYVWIDVPVDGLDVPEGEPVNIEGHAAHTGGISRVEVWVNAERQTTIENPPAKGNLASFTYSWTPPGPGEYTIQAISFGGDGAASQPDSARVNVGAPTLAFPDLAIVSVEALVAGDKDGVPFCNTRLIYTNAGEVAIPTNFAIKFSFDGSPVKEDIVAGGLLPGATSEATFVYQFVDLHNIGINLDSTELISESNETNNAFAEARTCGVVPTPGTATVTPTTGAPCPPSVLASKSVNCRVGPSTDYEAIGALSPGQSALVLGRNADSSWWVVERAGGGKCWVWGQAVQISSQTCDLPVIEAPPLPTITLTLIGEGDKIPPSAPQQAVPQNGLDIPCKASQTLAWLPVEDPSGIASYQVEVQRHSGDNNWKAVSGSPFTGIGSKSMDLTVECGWTYRWRVRAVDGAGNPSAWSGWWQFNVLIG